MKSKYSVSADKTPTTAGAFLDRGIMFASQREFEKAIADFTEALKINPNLGAAYELRGRALLALASASRFRDESDNFDGEYTIENSIRQGMPEPEQIGIYGRAIDDFTQAIRLNPRQSSIYIERGITYYAIAYYGRGLVYIVGAGVIAYGLYENENVIDFDKKGIYDKAEKAVKNRNIAYSLHNLWDTPVALFPLCNS